MRITKGDKTTDIPAWVLVLGIIVANVCSMVSFNKRCDLFLRYLKRKNNNKGEGLNYEVFSFRFT